MSQHVILGAGPAGLAAIEEIRRLDPDAEITLVADERPYARMALPYLLAGDVAERQIETASEASLERVGVECRLGRRARRVDASARRVELDDGESLRFDRLLVATGSSPRRPPIPGAEAAGVHTLWTLADATAVLAEGAAPRPSAILVGAGFIGLIVLTALLRRGWRVTLVEREGHVLPRMLDRRGAALVEARLRSAGVDVQTPRTVVGIEPGPPRSIALAGGTALGADVVILSTGVRPNAELLAGSGVAIADGVRVDERCQSSVEGIFAAGDVAAGPDLLGGPPAVHAIQTTAVDHGRVAGSNMAGREVAYAGSLRMNGLEVAGLHCASLGRWQEEADTSELWAPAESVYRKLVWEGDRLVGALLVGPAEATVRWSDLGMLKGLIQSRAPLGRWRTYLEERPLDLARAFLGARAASRLVPSTVLGEPSRARRLAPSTAGPARDAGPHHADLVGTRPPGFDSLPPTPTPGIHKRPST